MDNNLQKALASVQALIDEKNANIKALTDMVSELTDKLVVQERELELSKNRIRQTINTMLSQNECYEKAIRSLKYVFTDEFCLENDIYYVDCDGEIFYPSDL